MKLKGEYLITAGLLVMVAGVLTGLTLNDRDDDIWWKDRYYTVLEKHSPSLQEHGRRVYVEHYITLRYEDDGSSYVKEISPAKFFAVKEGGRYAERVERDVTYSLRSLVLILTILGLLLFCLGIVKTLR